MSQFVGLSSKGPVARVTFTRPEKLNALTPETYQQLSAALDEVERMQDIRVVVLQGEGRAFSAGFDIKRVREAKSIEARRDFIHKIANGNRWKIWNSSKLFVAKTHGYCLGGALELVFACDFCVTAKDCIFGEPEIRTGIGPTFLSLPFAMGHIASKAVLLRGQQFKGDDAVKYGIATESVEKDQLDAATDALVNDLLAVPCETAAMVKGGINKSYEARGMRSYVDNWADINLLIDPKPMEIKR